MLQNKVILGKICFKIWLVVWDSTNNPKDLIDNAQTLAAIAMAVARDAELVNKKPNSNILNSK